MSSKHKPFGMENKIKRLQDENLELKSYNKAQTEAVNIAHDCIRANRKRVAELEAELEEFKNKNLKDLVLNSLNLAKKRGRYENPHFIKGILNELENVYDFTDEKLFDWLNDMWSR